MKKVPKFAQSQMEGWGGYKEANHNYVGCGGQSPAHMHKPGSFDFSTTRNKENKNTAVHVGNAALPCLTKSMILDSPVWRTVGRGWRQEPAEFCATNTDWGKIK